jgi:hypothetical protein
MRVTSYRQEQNESSTRTDRPEPVKNYYSEEFEDLLCAAVSSAYSEWKKPIDTKMQLFYAPSHLRLVYS